MAGSKELEKLYNLFKEKAEAAAAEVHRVKDLKEAAALINTFVKDENVNKIAYASSPMVDRCLANTNLNAALHNSNLRKHAEDADLGISELDMAVADIGSLQQDCTDINKRLVSMLPPTHIALVKTNTLVANLKEAFSKLEADKTNIPGYMAFITGPSRTADIERVLTIGVHGPAKLKIVFVDNPGGADNE